MESSFLDLRCKQVINVIDGRNLGHITDIVFSLKTSCILGIIVPNGQNIWNILKPSEPLFIGWECVTKIGSDTILVEITGKSSQNFTLNKK